MRLFSVWLKPEEYEAVVADAATRGITMSKLVRQEVRVLRKLGLDEDYARRPAGQGRDYGKPYGNGYRNPE